VDGTGEGVCSVTVGDGAIRGGIGRGKGDSAPNNRDGVTASKKVSFSGVVRVEGAAKRLETFRLSQEGVVGVNEFRSEGTR
jgi:hypothetical protein